MSSDKGVINSFRKVNPFDLGNEGYDAFIISIKEPLTFSFESLLFLSDIFFFSIGIIQNY